MIAKFNTAAPAGVAAPAGAPAGKGGTMKTILIIGLLAAAGYGLYRYLNRKKPVAVVSVNQEEEY
jgi:hypothetical protein